MQGPLLKRSRLMGSWESRYCTLVQGGQWFVCFDNEEQSRKASKAKILPIAAGSVPVAWKCNEEELQDHKELWAFVIKGDKEYVFASSSKSEIDSWMRAFAAVSDETGSTVAFTTHDEEMGKVRAQLEKSELKAHNATVQAELANKEIM